MKPAVTASPTIVISDTLDSSFETLLGNGLATFNEQMTGYNDRQPLAVELKDPETGQVLGGISGRTSLGLLFIDLFYLPDNLRGSGLGAQLLRACEDEGRRRGCRSAVLYTLSFQAPSFYEKHGWQRFGEVACDPEGSSRVFMSKAL
ncbi:GNAT family N-acetyltransferase [Pseudomonas chlororaphis]|uniref:GNAT family N-acetyltransferase n=1 Tax=Pseudomonas chlororaphis TaxID=587753 RepID=UPI0007B34797|nr:GNAT family N-acetyltransferase [Pseudomonas chlororaphis]AZC56599.1 acetyltransferase [Pseudomonas chlororaphis subsp. piscium]AZC62817.1 acetyltransferase [Pseudomonas chlororaphis subsp. piscium]AZC69053.1 acetyltransferase [Pseudomonas chlororaphis subsp. piscium]AZC88705.1 acetyltransferase [Pseudomonas chlororaphis subsp. piscium]KZO49153.1 N-acetyltransferase GCN5 [Pseudomonas chlororaphis subsp. piscium]